MAKCTFPFATLFIKLVDIRDVAQRKDERKFEERPREAERYAKDAFERSEITPIIDNAKRHEKYDMLRDSYSKRAAELRDVRGGLQSYLTDDASSVTHFKEQQYSVDASVVPPISRKSLSKLQQALSLHKCHKHVDHNRTSLAKFIETGGASLVSVSTPPRMLPGDDDRPPKQAR
jgi:hypothetical protein